MNIENTNAFIYLTNGFYFGFVQNNILFSRNGTYLGWVENSYVWDAQGRFRGKIVDINSNKYIIRDRFSMPPLAKTPKPDVSSVMPPNPPPNIQPINLPINLMDAFSD